MTLPALVNPFQPFIGLAGTGLNQGALYVGVAGMDPQTNPQACFWDAAGTIPATQPISIVGGYTMYLGSPAQLFTAATFSLRLRDKPGGTQVFYLATANPPTGKADVNFGNVTAGLITGSFGVVGNTDPSLFYVDPIFNQVAIGEAGLQPYNKLWVSNSQTDMTVGVSPGHVSIGGRYAANGVGTAAINPVGMYGTLWYQPLLGDAHFTGAGAAVKGNAYTLNVPGVKADVDLLIGVYGRGRHESVLGTVNFACSFFADGAQKGAGGGAINTACAVYVQGNTQGATNYGVYFAGSPSHGCIAMAAGLNFTLSVGNLNVFQVLSTGNAILARADTVTNVLFEILNQATGPSAGSSLELATGTANSNAQLTMQDNAGSPYFLGALGSAATGWRWNGPLTAWQDNAGVEYARVTPTFLNHVASYQVAGSQVIGTRKHGWTAATGTATRTAFDTTTVTLPLLAEHFKALLDDLIAHGLVGA